MADAYDMGQLGQTVHGGVGARIALVEFAPFKARDIEHFESCVRSRAKVAQAIVDDGPTPAPSAAAREGELEAEADIEEVAALAPDATILVVEAPESTSQQVLDAYTTAINAHPDVVATSWGTCETLVSPSLLAGEATLFRRAAALGETVVAAAGDRGSEDCYNGTSVSAALAVDDPASQPDVVAVGGTTVGTAGEQSVWNDGTRVGAGGGGLSRAWAMPSYQLASARFASQAASRICPASLGRCRAVPDVSADAGVPVQFYCTIRSTCAGWTAFGGTSIGAPLWASIFALADVSSACHGHHLGFVDPALYQIANGPRHGQALRAVTSGNNDLLGSGTYFRATAGFNLAAGLGTPIVGDGEDGRLVSQLCSGVATANA